MRPFLYQLALEISGRFGDDPSQLCVVLPNRRAGLYLKKYLSEVYKKTIWAPSIYSTEDFILSQSGYQIIDPASLLFELYDVHTELAGEKAEPFETFMAWGQTLLSDFNEVDLYLAEPEKIFTFLNEMKALSTWNPGDKELTPFQKKYLEFYNSLGEYYIRLTGRLVSKKTVYHGLAYRLMAQHLGEIESKFTWSKIFFAGLNALTKAEEVIIDHLLVSGKAELFWDGDQYYMDHSTQEAGKFLSGYLNKWPSQSKKWIESNFKSGSKQITITGVPRNVGQAKMAGQVIQDIIQEKSASETTAVVLADENLLIPLLNSFPESVKQFNITMGYPVSNGPLYQLFRQLFQLNENVERFREKRNSGKQAIYVNDIIRLLIHPYLSINDGETKEAGSISLPMIGAKIRSTNKIFLSEQSIFNYFEGSPKELQELAHLIFSLWSGPADAVKRLLSLLEFYRDKFISLQQEGVGTFAIELEYLYLFSKIIRRMSTLLNNYKGIQNIHSLRKLLFQILDNTTLPFYGEPLKGLQVMGVLETRAIDFDNVIMLSVNEGIMPSGRTKNSFIPFEVKNEFGLPTYRDRDAVYAYHFYRLLQRATHIHLLYDTEGDILGGGEKSRFINQLLHELSAYNKQVHFKEEVLSIPPVPYSFHSDISIPKDEAVMAALMKQADKGLSPTHLSTYINCSLQFYFQVIAGLTEVEEIEETIEASTLGTVIHDVLRKIYGQFIKAPVNSNELRKNVKDLENLVAKSFTEKYQEGDIYHGKNYLIFKVAEFLTGNMVNHEIEELEQGSQVFILNLEEFFDATLNIGKENDLTVRIKGKIDRVDRGDGAIRIIDYKSGFVGTSDLNVKEMQDLISDTKKAKALQLLVYSLLYHENNKSAGLPVSPGIYALRNPSRGLMPLRVEDQTSLTEDHFGQVRELLVELLRQIYNPEIPFTQTTIAENCTYCAFRMICNRNGGK